MSALPHLFAAWGEVIARVRAARRVVLFLDFDGTLAPISARPEGAELVPATRRILRQLSHRKKFHIVILSGRRRADIMRRVRVKRARYLGLYGWERERGSDLPQEEQALLERVRSALQRELRHARGIHLEEKAHTLAVHFRGADPATALRVQEMLRERLRSLAPALRIVKGNEVWEIVPPQVKDKVVAVRRVLRVLGRPGLVIYAGDTAADERAFAALRDEITIHVGALRRTQARYRLRDPSELRIMLARLVEATP
jgi:trehalose-phosphatase